MTRVTSGKLGVDLTATNPLYVDATLPTVGPQANVDIVLGSCVTGADGTEFMFVHASAAIAQYDAVGIDENFQAAPLTTAMADDGWFVGFAQVAFADNDGGWVAIRGANIQCNVLASCAADVALFTTATAGSLDDATATTKVAGVVVVTGLGTPVGSTEVIVTFPRSSGF